MENFNKCNKKSAKNVKGVLYQTRLAHFCLVFEPTCVGCMINGGAPVFLGSDKIQRGISHWLSSGLGSEISEPSLS